MVAKVFCRNNKALLVSAKKEDNVFKSTHSTGNILYFVMQKWGSNLEIPEGLW